jgi:mannitol-specific phosphotransferase system IIBC component
MMHFDEVYDQTKDRASAGLGNRHERIVAAPMTASHKRLIVVAAVLFASLLGMLVSTIVLAVEYKQQNETLTWCYASSEASSWENSALQSANLGDDEEVAYATKQMSAALAPLGAPSSDFARKVCDARFYQ